MLASGVRRKGRLLRFGVDLGRALLRPWPPDSDRFSDLSESGRQILNNGFVASLNLVAGILDGSTFAKKVVISRATRLARSRRW